MITVVIAVGDSARGQNYRRLLAQTGFEGHFAADLGILARIVKSRPIDVVIYDVSPQFIPATDWLDMIAKDPDLGLTPVLWVGSGIVPSLARRLDAHRPGVRLAQLGDAPTLVEAIDRLIGRPRRTTPPSGILQPEGMPENWLPPDDTIDNALSIFSESGAIPIGEGLESTRAFPESARGPAGVTPGSRSAAQFKAPVPDLPGSPAKTPTPTQVTTAAAPNRPTAAPKAPQGIEDDEKLQVDIIRTGRHAARTGDSGSQKSLMAGEVSGSNPASGPVITELSAIDGIAAEVARRVAEHIVHNLDRDLIRREIEKVLEQRASSAKT